MDGNRAMRALRCTAAPSTWFALASRIYPASASICPTSADNGCQWSFTAPPPHLRVLAVLTSPYTRTVWVRRTCDLNPYQGVSSDRETNVRCEAKASDRCTPTSCGQRRGSSLLFGLNTRSSEPSGKTRSRVLSPTELTKIAKYTEQGGES